MTRATLRLASSVALAAVVAIATPAAAANAPAAPRFPMFGGSPIDDFYAARQGAPVWLGEGAASPAAAELVRILQRSSVDGYARGPEVAAEAQALMMRAAAGDRGALDQADHLLSSAWVGYASLLHRKPAGMTFAEQWIAPRTETPQEILQVAVSSPSLIQHIRNVASVNPVYAALRDAAWSDGQTSGASVDPRVRASLDRARVFRDIQIDLAQLARVGSHFKDRGAARHRFEQGVLVSANDRVNVRATRDFFVFVHGKMRERNHGLDPTTVNL